MFKISPGSPAYYPTSVAKDRLPVFRSEEIKSIAARALDEGRNSRGFLIFAYGIMPDHLHLVTDSNKKPEVIFLGYPLHPPGRPEKMRDEHLKSIRAPMLFIQGSRDAFGTPEELRAVIERDGLPASLQVIDGGDHSFKVPKTSALSQQQVYDKTMDQIANWSNANSK